MSNTTVLSRRPRRALLGATGVFGGLVLALTVPAMAGAHVTVSPDELAAGDHGVLTFSFAHGCGTSPTTALRVSIPDGLASVAPTLDGDWSIQVERGDDGLVNAVTYTALTPVPTDLRGAVSMSVGLDENTPETLAFPVVQQCVEGATEWTQLAEKDEDPHDLDAPAPVVTVTDATGGGHGTSATPEPATADAGDDALSIALGAGGLLAGVAALVVAVLALRRRA